MFSWRFCPFRHRCEKPWYSYRNIEVSGVPFPAKSSFSWKSWISVKFTDFHENHRISPKNSDFHGNVGFAERRASKTPRNDYVYKGFWRRRRGKLDFHGKHENPGNPAKNAEMLEIHKTWKSPEIAESRKTEICEIRDPSWDPKLTPPELNRYLNTVRDKRWAC